MEGAIHRVLLADLKDLAEAWDISTDSLGLEIDAEGNLVPMLIDDGDDVASLSQMLEVAERDFPANDMLDLVVQIQESESGNKMRIRTISHVCSVTGRACNSRWWMFTDTYKDRTH